MTAGLPDVRQKWAWQPGTLTLFAKFGMRKPTTFPRQRPSSNTDWWVVAPTNGTYGFGCAGTLLVFICRNVPHPQRVVSGKGLLHVFTS